MNKNKNMLNNEENSNEDATVLSMYMKELNKLPLITHEEEVELFNKIKKGDLRARNKMIESNLRFVVKIAKKYQNQGLPLADLIDEGNIGLMTALDKYDVDKGYHFISYAVWWIRQSIMKAINEKSRAVRLPLNRSNELLQIQKAQKNLMHKFGEEPSVDMLAQATNLEPTIVKTLVSVSKDMVSLDAPVFKDNETSNIGDYIESDLASPDQQVMETLMREDINEALDQLSDKEKDIIEHRFGLNNKSQMSLKEIGEIYNLTKERIRQIEKRAIQKLHNTEIHRSLESYSA
ncbi:MAG: RNA polymerase sigma factor RpoD/SigA [Sphaerochaetaceae bacterium]|nr:RNA polymerase sigma factor RpoD/SigA [Sphaerochaetaceae bacterium]MDC7237022.1 RNA polymerase sigma factor RpoD/SigA [Sphaerochaetaceae bacterium]MDC7242413.1 RNA polymerase sigma factor RpoD/SigA [Sphaerochaetaceae bacterium]MDC7249675.1 RNA polymerase sigma factor RpoD/SigA [Sphaerochaetaceae bacterium]